MEFSRNAEKAPIQFWEKVARDDPYSYILTNLRGQDPRKFWQSGELTTQQELLPLIKMCSVKTGIGLELGCGVGRLVFPLARHFLEVVGVDIAESMVRRALSFAHDNNIYNTTFVVISGPEDLLHKVGNYAGKINFLYSLLVFQHVHDFSVIEGYLHVISVLLEENGTAYLQFDTRQQDFFYWLKTILPDFLLPQFWRRGIRRVRRSSEEIEAGLRRAGLEIISELTAHTSYHRYLLKRMPIPLAAK